MIHYVVLYAQIVQSTRIRTLSTIVNLYINDIMNVSSKYVLFADDTVILCEEYETVENIVNKELHRLLTKTSFVVFSKVFQ